MKNNERNSLIARKCIICSSQSLKKSPAILSPFIVKRMFDWEVIDIEEEFGLYDIKDGKTYCPCKTQYCEKCDLLFSDFRPLDDDASIYYDGYHSKEFFDMRCKTEPSFRGRLESIKKGTGDLTDGRFILFDKIEDFLKEYTNLNGKKFLKILDYGGDGGLNTPFSELKTSEVHIFDINSNISRKAKGKNKNEITNELYDLIVFRHVIEHLAYPIDAIISVINKLNAQGYIYIEVPYEPIMREHFSSSSELVKSKKLWNEHINFFSPKAMQSMAENISLKHIKTDILSIPGSKLTEKPRQHIMSIYQKIE